MAEKRVILHPFSYRRHGWWELKLYFPAHSFMRGAQTPFNKLVLATDYRADGPSYLANIYSSVDPQRLLALLGYISQKLSTL